MTSQSKPANLLSYHLFVHATSGSAASLVALLSIFPLLTIIQRKQCKLNLQTELWSWSAFVVLRAFVINFYENF